MLHRFLSKVSVGWRIAQCFNICNVVLVLFLTRFVSCTCQYTKEGHRMIEYCAMKVEYKGLEQNLIIICKDSTQ